MTQSITPVPESEPALEHQFIRLFGRDPSPSELQRYQRARAQVGLRLPSRTRRGAARLIVRL